MTELLEEVSNLLDETSLHFYDLAKQLADGENIPAPEVAKHLRDWDKTTAELQKEIVKIKRRRQAREELTAIRALQVERAELIDKLDGYNATLDQAVTLHQTNCYPLRARIQQIDQEGLRAIGLERELMDCPDERLNAAMAQNQRAISAIENRRKENRRNIDRWDAELSTARHGLNDLRHSMVSESEDSANRDIDHARQRLAEARENEAAMNAEIDSLVAEQNRIHQAMQEV